MPLATRTDPYAAFRFLVEIDGLDEGEAGRRLEAAARR